MNNMCWCKDCEWFYKEHCSNVKSDMCTEMMGDYSSCEHSKKRMSESETVEFLLKEVKKEK